MDVAAVTSVPGTRVLISAVLYEHPAITVVKRRTIRSPHATDVTVLAATIDRTGAPVIVNLSAALCTAFADRYRHGGLFNGSRTVRLPYGGKYAERLARELTELMWTTSPITVTEV